MKILKSSMPKLPEEDRLLRDSVSAIINHVRTAGDQALMEYGQKWDNATRLDLRVSSEEIRSAYKAISPSLLEAIQTAAANIRRFAEAQKATVLPLQEQEMSPGVFLGHRILPIDACGCYVPGGAYPLFSTALMLTIPARVAGVRRVVACSPAMKTTGMIHPATLVALDIAGADEIYVTGGAQAIAALAYGTEKIAPVDVIVGPGNQYVTEAKRQCYGQVGIDFVAGPSEVLIIADDSAHPAIVAADLLAQAEHDLQARGILITTSETLARSVESEVEKQLQELSTAGIARKAWAENSEILLVDSLIEACQISNTYAPEHLEIVTTENELLIPLLSNYGALFIGELSAEVFGDYVSGTHHTRPTLRASRYTGGVWIGTFQKVCTTQRLSTIGLSNLGPRASIMAREEGLIGHARAAEIRMEILPSNTSKN